MIVLTWFILSVLIAISLHFWIIPFLTKKYLFWIVLRKLKKVKKNHPEIEEMDEVVDLAKEVYKNHNIDEL